MRIILALIIATASGVSAAFAAESQPSDARGIESLGRELLDGLSPDTLRSPRNGSEPTQLGSENDNGGHFAPRSSPHAPRFNDLGEDIGQPSDPLALARIRGDMQQAKSLLGATNSGGATDTLQQVGAVQQQVVDQLDTLIAQLSKQCQGGQCKPSDSPPKPSQRSQAKPGNSGSAAGRGQTAARDSTDRLDRATAQKVEKGDIDAMVKDLWGHLPERSREQMLQSFSDEFLPKYELEIEQYYRRLSEENEVDR